MLRGKSILKGLIYVLVFVGLLTFFESRNNPSLSFGELLKKIKDSTTTNTQNLLEQKTILTQSLVEEESAVIKVVEDVSPAVVSVVTKTVDFDPFTGPSSSESGIGTGFIVEDTGLIITNSHVVSEGANSYSVVLKDGRSFDVKDIHRDPSNDLAILEIDATDLPIVTLGDSSALKVGQKAIAIGNALGQFSNTVTLGIVSGLARQVTASGPFGTDAKTYNDVIQTDAGLNPGNSGGPLLNLSSQVIGVNVATTRGAENIGFAIPINTLKPILESFKKNGKIIRPFLGVSFSMITKDISELQRLPQGAFIRAVSEDSPASEAGLERGDIITKINEVDLNEQNPLDKIIQQNHKVGERITLTIDRQSEILTRQLNLIEAPEE